MGGSVGAVYLLDPSGVDLAPLLTCFLPEFCFIDPQSTILASHLISSENQASGGTFSEQLEISFVLAPGQTFFIGAVLQAVGDRGGSADGELLDLGFTGPAGFLDDLVPASTKVVPVPAALPMLLAALGIGGLLTRRATRQ